MASNNNSKLVVPNINSSEREERIAARRLRIKNRKEQRKLGMSPSTLKPGTSLAIDSKEQPTVNPTQNLIEKSKSSFYQVLQEGLEEMTNIQMESNSREQVRRAEYEQKSKDLEAKKKTEFDETQKLNQDISKNWSRVLERKVAQDLLREIEEQKTLCESVNASKTTMIKEFDHEIKTKEEDFSKILALQTENIDNLIARMRTQLKKLASSCEQELSLIEDSFEDERKRLQNSNRIEMDELAEERRNKEVKYMDWRQERDEQARKQLEELRVIKAEEYNQLKIKLETEIQILEQALQRMKAIYQLNNEKLEFNLHMLDERESEHEQLIHQQKKKINRLQDLLSTIKAKYVKMDKKFRQKNVELTDEYKRTTEQYKDLQLKYKHFQEKDHKKYLEIRNMNEERVALLMQKILQADKVITEQQLGMNWYPPKSDLFKRDSEKLITEKLKPLMKQEKSNTIAYGNGVKRIVEMISNEAGFLVEEKVRKLVEPLEKEEQTKLKINSIMKALGVEDDETAEALFGYFVKDEETQELIEVEDAVIVLKEFVTRYREKKRGVDSNGTDSATKSQILTVEEEYNERKERNEEKEFWERLGNVVPQKHIQVWDVLEQELLKYNYLLNDRATLLAEADDIRQQNDQLKQLLNHYISLKVNQDLKVPPVSF